MKSQHLLKLPPVYFAHCGSNYFRATWSMYDLAGG